MPDDTQLSPVATTPPARPARRGPVDPRLLRYASASRRFFVAIAVIGLAQALTIVAFAWLITRAVVDAIAAQPLAATLWALTAVVIVRGLLMWAREAVASRAAARVQAQLRENLIAAVDVLGPDWLATHNTAHLAVTAGRGLDSLEAYFGRYLPQLVQTVIATPLLLVVMWWHDWISGLTVLLTLPLIPLFMILIGLATRTVQNTQWNTLQALAARFTDTVQGLSTLKVFGRQHRAAESVDTVTTRYRVETMRVLRVSFLSGFALEFLASVSVAIIAVTIGFRLIDGSLALIVGLFVLLLAPEAYLPIRQVGVQFHAAAEGVSATENVFAVLDAARGITPRPVTTNAARPGAGELVMGSVSVHRGDRMLAPLTFTATPGTITLIEGPSGAGKTSLLAALRGAATFDGHASFAGADVRTLSPATWLGWTGQQPGLVAGTVGGNVTLGDGAPDAALTVRALDLACAGSIEPGHELGVQGAGLSGGQAQRVAVARAIYRHLRGWAPVIALDEPSAALDAGTEQRLWGSLQSLAAGGATILLVSHRASARTIATQIISVTPSTVAPISDAPLPGTHGVRA